MFSRIFFECLVEAEKSDSDIDNSSDESSPEEEDEEEEEEDDQERELDYSCGDGSDLDEPYLDVSNKSANTTESENTTHSYSNSLLESEDEDVYASGGAVVVEPIPADDAVDRSPPDLSDLNNGKGRKSSV